MTDTDSLARATFLLKDIVHYACDREYEDRDRDQVARELDAFFLAGQREAQQAAEKKIAHLSRELLTICIEMKCDTADEIVEGIGALRTSVKQVEQASAEEIKRLKSNRDALVRRIEAEQNYVMEWGKRVDAAEARVKTLTEALRRLEWVDVPQTTRTGRKCPACRRGIDRREGHTVNCWLAAALEDQRPAPSPEDQP